MRPSARQSTGVSFAAQYGGLRTFGMAAASESYFRLHGSLSLLAVVPGDMEATNLLRLRPRTK